MVGDVDHDAVGPVANELYGLDPGQFTASRDQRAAALRGEGQTDLAKVVKALKRPAAPAWAVNILARERPGEVSDLLALGGQLRDAQARLSGDDLRRLTRERQRVVAALAADARRLAAERGHNLTEPAVRQVEQTLTAALADPDAAAAVRSGRLVKPLEHAGIGPVDLEGAVAGPLPAAPPQDIDSGGRDVEAWRAELVAARSALRDAELDKQRQEEAQRRAREDAARADAEASRLERELERARRAAQQAHAKADELVGSLADAERTATEAGRRVDELEERIAWAESG